MTARRWRAQWRLVVAVLSVTLFACTLVTGLGLVVSTTEQSGLSSALGSLSDEQSRITLGFRDPTGTAADTREQATEAIAAVLGPSATIETSGSPAFTSLTSAAGQQVYLAEGASDSAVRIVDGEWPTDSDLVAAPVTADLALGDTLVVNDTTMTVVGRYEVADADDPFWQLDPLRGAGTATGSGTVEGAVTIGPLLVPLGGVDATALPLDAVQVAFGPRLGSTPVAELEALSLRLDAAGIEVPRDLRDAAGSRVYESRLDESVHSIATALIVTRSTVIVISLLLLVLAVAAIAQAARLLTEARAADRELLLSRGASSRQLFALVAVEAVALGALTAVMSPQLAALAYRVFAATPLAVAAGVPGSAQLTLTTWLTAVAVSVIFVVILAAPAVVREQLVDDETKSRGPQRAVRTGLDVALLVLAGFAYAQLQLYRSPADSTASLAIDPILVVGPALALLAGALVCLRLLGPISRLLARIGSRSVGIVVPLVGWELGRRAQRSAPAVLLLSLALAVGTFSLSFLATWRESQVDQAELSVGAPARTLDEPSDGSPVLRLSGRLGASADDADPNAGRGGSAQVLGLGADARALIDRGRLSELGGGLINDRVDVTPAPSAGMTLTTPGELSAVVRVGNPALPHPDVAVSVTAVVEDASGVLHAVDWGLIALDGTGHPVTGAVEARGARLVGVTVTFPAGQGLEQAENVDIAVSGTDGSPAPDGWFLVSGDGSSRAVTMPGDGTLEVEATVLGVSGARPSTIAVVAWQPAERLQAVIPSAIAKVQQLSEGDRLTLVVRGIPVAVEVAGATELVPGSAPFAQVASGEVGVRPSVVVDHTLLERALAQAGYTGSFVGEWWTETTDDPDAVTSSALARQLQGAPLRIATPVTLWTAIVAGALLAAIGFLLHTTMSLRGRRLELAQLGALGIPRSRLRVLVTVESLVVGGLGALFGAAIGVLLALLIGPLVAASPTGEPPVPPVVVSLPWLQFVALDLSVAAVLAVVVLGVARGRAFVHPAELLRGGRE
jgi:hypothetical protein